MSQQPICLLTCAHAGKTIQCAAFLAGLIQGRLIRRAVVVAPKTLLAQWRKELGVCGLQGQAHEYGGSAGERWVY